MRVAFADALEEHTHRQLALPAAHEAVKGTKPVPPPETRGMVVLRDVYTY